MEISADNQLQKININQIKTILNKLVPDQFDKIIIEEQHFKRADYVYSEMKFQKVVREIELIKFPLFNDIEKEFMLIEGGEKKLGQKLILKNDNILKILSQKYNLKSSRLTKIHVQNPLEFPFNESNNQINNIQNKFFFPDLTYKENCSYCNANKYVICPDNECRGRHDYKCPTCKGNKKVDCNPCRNSGYLKCSNCKGGGELKCSKCSGKGERKCNSSGCNNGYITNGGKKQKCNKCSGRGFYPCSDCRNGIVNCNNCGAKGEIRCDNCNGKGEINCNYCNGQGNLICKTCYGDKNRFGMIDCPTCKTMGFIATLVYVDTIVLNDSINKLTFKGDNIDISKTLIEKHIVKDIAPKKIYKKLNESIFENFDKYSIKYAADFEKELNLKKDNFPMVVKESINYQIIPCVEIIYKHILTNEEHKITIIDIWKNPEVVFQSNSEQLNQNLHNAKKSIGNLIGRLFKTNNFKIKEDKKNEIILLIYLAKVDNKIEEQEKNFLSQIIGSLDHFTNSEKQILFNLLDSKSLPELTTKETNFSSKERANEVIANLYELAMTDGDLNETEKQLIIKIEQLINN